MTWIEISLIHVSQSTKMKLYYSRGKEIGQKGQGNLKGREREKFPNASICTLQQSQDDPLYSTWYSSVQTGLYNAQLDNMHYTFLHQPHAYGHSFSSQPALHNPCSKQELAADRPALLSPSAWDHVTRLHLLQTAATDFHPG